MGLGELPASTLPEPSPVTGTVTGVLRDPEKFSLVDLFTPPALWFGLTLICLGSTAVLVSNLGVGREDGCFLLSGDLCKHGKLGVP